MAARRVTTSPLEELHESRKIDPGWCSYQHMHVGLEHRNFDDYHFVFGGRLLEEFLQEIARRRIDHRPTIKSGPRQMDEELNRGQGWNIL